MASAVASSPGPKPPKAAATRTAGTNKRYGASVPMTGMSSVRASQRDRNRDEGDTVLNQRILGMDRAIPEFADRFSGQVRGAAGHWDLLASGKALMGNI